MTILRILLALVVGAALALGLSFGLQASAQPNTTYYACLSSHGALSKVGTSAPTCTGGKQLISWNSQGPVGPQGPPGANGVTYDCSVAPYAGVDLADCTLTDEDLQSANLTGADLASTDLNGAD
jgi:uncharacterized protein YjbI with pentapeptide repeats